MKHDDSNAYIKTASGILYLEKHHRLSTNIKDIIQQTDESYRLRHNHNSEDDLHCIKLNIINKQMYPFNYLQAKYGLTFNKNSFGKEKLFYSKELVKNCGILKQAK